MNSARLLAVTALTELQKNSAYSNIALNNALNKSNLTAQDKALATSLFYGVLDRKITLDFVLSQYLKSGIEKLPLFTAFTLRVALYQIMYMDRIPDSAAVNEAVNTVKSSKFKYQSSLVNAVLRNIIRSGVQIPHDNSVKSLSIRYSCPEIIVSEFVGDYGVETAEKLLCESVKAPPTVIRVNTLKTSADELAEILLSEGISTQKGTVQNSLVTVGLSDIKSLKSYKDGLFHIQDTASQRAVSVLCPKPHTKVADICAAPGGKSFTMAQYMQNTGEIFSFDLYSNRVDLIKNGAKRLGIDIIKADVHDATVFDGSYGDFDYVLCDVPCSGLGVIRRKPEIKYKGLSDFSQLQEIQRVILENAAGYLKTGGRLLYSTCTLRKAENEEQIKAFLDKNTGYELQYECTFMPHTDNSDGFYCALLVRTGS